jgi:hypothetical protein
MPRLDKNLERRPKENHLVVAAVLENYISIENVLMQ